MASVLESRPVHPAKGDRTCKRRNVVSRAALQDLHERALAAHQESRFIDAYDLFGQLVPLARNCLRVDYLAWVLRSLGEAAVFTGNHSVAASALMESASLCENLDDHSGHAHCIFLLGQIAANECRADDAEILFERSGEIAEKAGDQAGVAVSLRARGEIAAWRRESDRAAEILFKARRAFVAIEDRYGEASVLQVLARVQATLGRIQSAQKCLGEALELANAIGDPQVKAWVLLNIGAFCADWRGAEGAENALNEAMALFHQTGDRLGQAQCHGTLATACSRLRKYDEASNSLAIAREIYLELGNPAKVAVVSAQMPCVLVAQGNCAAAADLYRQHIETIRRYGSVASLGVALCGLGEALGRGGDVDAARAPFAEARALFAGIGDQSELARADMIEGEVLVRVGREADGAALLRRGLDRYDSIGALGPERPEDLVPKALARIKRQMGDAQGGN